MLVIIIPGKARRENRRGREIHRGSRRDGFHQGNVCRKGKSEEQASGRADPLGKGASTARLPTAATPVAKAEAPQYAGEYQVSRNEKFLGQSRSQA